MNKLTAFGLEQVFGIYEDLKFDFKVNESNMDFFDYLDTFIFCGCPEDIARRELLLCLQEQGWLE